ncbi:hypothetical protein [Lysinibacillus xylanilyticus]|uniref:hypothetical protein n=1 Tax=Lysinibacillus xylanilyticus TaxID=582475 RepID=UPI003D07657D
MNKILKEFNLPGSTTHPVIIPRKSLRNTSDKKIALQLALQVVDAEHKSTK